MRLLSDRAGGATTLSRDPRGGRGMALLMVLTALAILTALAVEFSYNTRVDASLAANARDELRAYYLARSAQNLSRLMLHFQFQLDQQTSQLQQAARGAMGGGGGQSAEALAGMAAAGAAAAAMPRIRLWDIIPIESGAITTFVGAAASAAEEEPEAPAPDEAPEPGKAAPAAGLLSFGTFDGSFHAELQDEEAKLNLNKLNNPGTRGAIAAAQLMLLWNDPRWDFLFDRENEQRERVTREDLLIRLRDYIDEDEVETTLNTQNPAQFFVPGFGDEVGPYTRYEPRFQPKNALFDTLDEVFLVAGVGDRLMTAFRDRLTVYPDINARLNVNTNDPVQQYVNILAAAQDPNQPALRDPLTIQLVLEQLALARMMGPFIGLSVQQFVGVVESAGIAIQPTLKHNVAQNDYLGDRSQTFTIKSVGQVGDVQKTLVTVVRYDAGLGRLLYYREE